jgi:hypothetical protein
MTSIFTITATPRAACSPVQPGWDNRRSLPRHLRSSVIEGGRHGLQGPEFVLDAQQQADQAHASIIQPDIMQSIPCIMRLLDS